MKSALSQVLKDEDKRRLYDQVIVPSSLRVVSILSLMEYPCMLSMLYGLLNVSFSLILFGATITWVKFGIKSKILSESLSRL